MLNRSVEIVGTKMSMHHHSHGKHAHEQAPKSDFIIANLEKETSAGTLHALSELQDLSKKDPKAFARVLAEVNEKVDTSFLSIDKDGKSHGDLQIVGFDKCGGLIMKDENDELFDPRVNLKNGILEIRRPLDIPAVDTTSGARAQSTWMPQSSN